MSSSNRTEAVTNALLGFRVGARVVVARENNVIRGRRGVIVGLWKPLHSPFNGWFFCLDNQDGDHGVFEKNLDLELE